MINNLYDAVYKGDKAEVIKNLTLDPSLIDVQKSGYTPVHIACRSGHKEMVEELIRRGANVDIARPDSWTPLHSACWASHPEVVKVLLNKTNANKQNSDGWNALHLASMVNNYEIVKCLVLDAKADVGTKTMSGETALDIARKHDPKSKVTDLLKKQMILTANWTELHFACYYNEYESLLDILKNNISSLDECNAEGCTALHLACERGHLDIIKKLLECKVPVNIKDKEEQTALHTASRYGQTAIVKLLLDAKADTNIVDKYGETAIGIALRNNHFEVVKCLEEQDGSTPLHTAIRCKDISRVKDLISKQSIDINAVTTFGYTALHYASRQGNTEMVRILKDSGADVDIPRKDGWTALQSASSLGYTEVVREILFKSTSINNKNKDGMTALHYACKYGHHDVVQLLIESKADVSMLDFGGQTALHHASYSGKPETLKLLLKEQPNLIDQADHHGYTAMQVAITCNHLCIVELLQEEGASMNRYCTNGSGNTPLHHALILGCEEIAKYLIENGCADDVNKATLPEKKTALHIACSNGQLPMVKLLLLKGAQPGKTDIDEYTALHHAVRSENCEVVQCILEANIVIINNKDAKHNTALQLAAMKGDCSVGVCKVLINAKADVNSENVDGDTALHIASARGFVCIVNELLEENNIVVDAMNNEGDTPSYIARKKNHGSIEMAILKKTPMANIENLQKWLVNNIGTDISSKSYEFGIQLQLKENTLRCIMKRCAQETNETIFSQVVYEWIRRLTIPVTWGNLIEALEKIGEQQLACKIRAMK